MLHASFLLHLLLICSHCISPYSLQMRENMDQNNSEYEYFSRSESVIVETGHELAVLKKFLPPPHTHIPLQGTVSLCYKSIAMRQKRSTEVMLRFCTGTKHLMLNPFKSKVFTFQIIETRKYKWEVVNADKICF